MQATRNPDDRAALAEVYGGRLLDAATGGGQFIAYLRERLRDCTEMVGIDVDDSASARFATRFGDDPRVRFAAMDVRHLDFPPRTFDTASIAHSLCEIPEPLAALRGLVRVVRDGGHLIVAESYRDQVTEPTISHVLLHDWWVAVERLDGASHRPFRSRRALARDLESLGLSDLRLVDVPSDQTDPWDPGVVRHLAELADRYAALARGRPALQRRGVELMARVRDVGFMPATAVLAVGRVDAGRGTRALTLVA